MLVEQYANDLPKIKVEIIDLEFEKSFDGCSSWWLGVMEDGSFVVVNPAANGFNNNGPFVSGNQSLVREEG